jgi:ribose-phosphate pyrophosphokinase
MLLTEAPQQRGLVRLRRLSRLVRQRAEPLLAEFGMRTAEGERLRAEIILAPLSETVHLVDGIFGGLALRHTGFAHPAPSPVGRTQPRPKSPLLFALNSARVIGEQIARHLNQPLQRHEEREFEDGEHKARPLVDVHGRSIHLIAGLHGDGTQSVNDRLCRLLFFIAALKDGGAAQVTVIAPYLCYARKDRQTKPHDPVTLRYVGQLFETVGTDRLITMEVHNLAAFQNAFRCSTTHLTPYAAFCRYIAGIAADEPLAVVSPDIGGAKRAESFRQDLERRLRRPISKGVADKQRSMGQVSGDLFMGDVSGATAIILDDLISTGTTMVRVAQQCRDRGAKRVIVAATHGVGGTNALLNLTHPSIDTVLLTNTIPQPPEFMNALSDRLVILDISEILARALYDSIQKQGP